MTFEDLKKVAVKKGIDEDEAEFFCIWFLMMMLGVVKVMPACIPEAMWTMRDIGFTPDDVKRLYKEFLEMHS